MAETPPTTAAPKLTKWSLGIASETGKLIIVIPKGTALPARRSVVVTTITDSQPNIGLNIVLGSSPRSKTTTPWAR